jgi:hypothetical protein
VVSYFARGSETSYFTYVCWEIVSLLKDYWLLKEDSTLVCYLLNYKLPNCRFCVNFNLEVGSTVCDIALCFQFFWWLELSVNISFFSRSLSLSLWLYSPLELGRFFSFLILHTFSRTPWTGDQTVARPLPTHRTTQIQNNARKHPCLEWVSTLQTQCSSERSRFMP